jgi:hypothetical protein
MHSPESEAKSTLRGQRSYLSSNLGTLRLPTSDETLDDDRFFIPVVLNPPSGLHSFSSIERFPFELLIKITSYLPLTNLLSITSTSRHLRSTLLGFSSDRDAVAHAWIKCSAPWYLPTSDNSVKPRKSKGVIGWLYLRRCLESGSMKNRRRISKVVEQLWKIVDDLAL